MTDKLEVAKVPEEKTAVAPVDQVALLNDVVARVRRDSTERSEQYLDETTVPHGGE